MKMILINLGCVAEHAMYNRVRKQMKAENIEFTSKFEEADFITLITCGGTGDVIKKDEKKLYQPLINLIQMEEYKDKKLILVGCLAYHEFFDDLQELSNIIIIKEKNFVEPLFNIINKANNKTTKKNILDNRCWDILDNNRAIHFMIEKGCINHCSFCKTHYYNDFSQVQSLEIEDVLEYLKEKIKNGCTHITLSGDNLALYGLDLYGKQRLHELINILSKEKKLISIELNELVPGNMYKELEEEILSNKKITSVSMQLETASNRLLKLMNRNYTLESFDYYAKKFKERGIRISTIILSGFPTETEEDIQLTLNYLRTRKIELEQIAEYDDFEYIPSHKLPQYKRLEKRQHTKKYREFRKINNLEILKDLGKSKLKFTVVRKQASNTLFISDSFIEAIGTKKEYKDLEIGSQITTVPKKVLKKSKYRDGLTYKI